MIRQVNAEDESVLKCTACSHERPFAQFSAGQAGPRDWVELVKILIRTCVNRTKEIETHKREAERLVAALQAYGADGIPDLPWKASRKPAAAGPKLQRGPRALVACVKCGFEADGVRFLSTDEGRVCRDAAACGARRLTPLSTSA